ncbi:hypothetical protein F4779DRAFT_590339 [Xylariaceae sp. FL0662B]|nr:hypothetical protein F4779DRAFT_590339 [Xylariaceae sp. FL0662B]
MRGEVAAKPTRAKKRKRDEKVYRIMVPSYTEIDFNVLCLDEAHILKNCHSTHNRMVKCIPRKRLIMCMATPIINTPMEVLAYALLSWPDARPHAGPAKLLIRQLLGSRGRHHAIRRRR